MSIFKEFDGPNAHQAELYNLLSRTALKSLIFDQIADAISDHSRLSSIVTKFKLTELKKNDQLLLGPETTKDMFVINLKGLLAIKSRNNVLQEDKPFPSLNNAFPTLTSRNTNSEMNNSRNGLFCSQKMLICASRQAVSNFPTSPRTTRTVIRSTLLGPRQSEGLKKLTFLFDSIRSEVAKDRVKFDMMLRYNKRRDQSRGTINSRSPSNQKSIICATDRQSKLKVDKENCSTSKRVRESSIELVTIKKLKVGDTFSRSFERQSTMDDSLLFSAVSDTSYLHIKISELQEFIRTNRFNKVDRRRSFFNKALNLGKDFDESKEIETLIHKSEVS